MKAHRLFLAAVLAASLCSCQKQNAISAGTSDKSDRIVFGIQPMNVTKAYSENTSAEIQANGFNVAGLTASGTLLFNEKATYSEGAYSPVNGPYYYPESGNMDFFAVYPVSQSISVTGGAATLSYTQDGDIDLLGAKKTGVAKSASSVPLSFDHILSLLKFKAEGTDAAALYKVKTVKVTVPGSGTYTYSSSSWSAGTSSQCIFSDTVTELSGVTAIAGAMTVIPCTPAVYVEWDTYSLDGSILYASYSDSKSLGEAVAQGKESTITLKLPNGSVTGISFTVSVNTWQPEDKILNF